MKDCTDKEKRNCDEAMRERARKSEKENAKKGSKKPKQELPPFRRRPHDEASALPPERNRSATIVSLKSLSPPSTARAKQELTTIATATTRNRGSSTRDDARRTRQRGPIANRLRTAAYLTPPPGLAFFVSATTESYITIPSPHLSAGYNSSKTRHESPHPPLRSPARDEEVTMWLTNGTTFPPSPPQM